MLAAYARASRALHRARAALFAGLLAGVGFFLAGLFGPGDDFAESRVLLPALVCLWCLCMLVVAYSFRGAIPTVNRAHGFWRRVATRLRQLLWHVLALLMAGLGVATLLLTLRALIIVRDEWPG